MQTKHKFRKLNPVSETQGDSHHKCSGVEDLMDTAGVETSARVRTALDAAKAMISHHQAEVRYWQKELADLESQVNSDT
jgi:hypothetical protein